MLEQIFASILPSETAAGFSVSGFLICTAASILLGVIIALLCMFRSNCSKSFVVTLALLPAIVQMVIMLVNGNLGTGVAVMGAFSLVRFRSIPGTAKEIASIFLAMAVGLATGMGYLAAAAVFVPVSYTHLPARFPPVPCWKRPMGKILYRNGTAIVTSSITITGPPS